MNYFGTIFDLSKNTLDIHYCCFQKGRFWYHVTFLDQLDLFYQALFSIALIKRQPWFQNVSGHTRLAKNLIPSS